MMTACRITLTRAASSLALYGVSTSGLVSLPEVLDSLEALATLVEVMIGMRELGGITSSLK